MKTLNEAKEEEVQRRRARALVRQEKEVAKDKYGKANKETISSSAVKIKELESEVNKLKVILGIRDDLEDLNYILKDVVHWDTCPDEFKQHISKVLKIDLDEYEDDGDTMMPTAEPLFQKQTVKTFTKGSKGSKDYYSQYEYLWSSEEYKTWSASVKKTMINDEYDLFDDNDDFL